ncbi:MAG TPA: TROVE domain-containing protein [Bacillota bacterium]|nr:TROVE domain-containing protein [Bacillota bacterium]
MSRLTKLFTFPVPDLKNRDGYPAYQRPLQEQYLQTLLTNTIGNTFYADKNELLQEAIGVHDAMIQKDAGFVAKALPYARKKGCLRLQPALGLAKLAGTDDPDAKEIFKNVFEQVILIPSDLQDFMTILEGSGRGQGGRAIKNAVAKWLNQYLTEYWAIKYYGRGRGFSLADIIQTVHPEPGSEVQSRLFKYLISGENAYREGKIYAFEQLKKAQSPAEQIRWILEGQLPYEVVTSVCKMTPELWNALTPNLPLFALLRNLNTLERAGILDQHRGMIERKFTNQEMLRRAKIMPFRFLNAFQAVEKAWVKDVLRQAVELTFANLPDIPGKTAVFLDVSGSMGGEYLRIGSVFALALYKKTKGNGLFRLFNTTVHDPKVSLHDAILSQAERIRADGGTDTGAPLRALQEKVDNVIIITDEQQNTGSPFYKELVSYRKRYNRDAMCFVIDLAPYRSEMVPPADPLTHYIYGWSDQVLQYISFATHGYASVVEMVREAV